MKEAIHTLRRELCKMFCKDIFFWKESKVSVLCNILFWGFFFQFHSSKLCDLWSPSVKICTICEIFFFFFILRIKIQVCDSILL